MTEESIIIPRIQSNNLIMPVANRFTASQSRGIRRPAAEMLQVEGYFGNFAAASFGGLRSSLQAFCRLGCSQITTEKATCRLCGSLEIHVGHLRRVLRPCSKRCYKRYRTLSFTWRQYEQVLYMYIVLNRGQPV